MKPELMLEGLTTQRKSMIYTDQSTSMHGASEIYLQITLKQNQIISARGIHLITKNCDKNITKIKNSKKFLEWNTI
jgi:hypothetical protein